MAQTNFTPILTYKSDTASAVPSAGNLTNSANGAELAVNTADKRLFTKDSGGSVVELGTNPSSLTLPNGTANGVVYANGSKVLTTGSALTFDGSVFQTSLGAGLVTNTKQLVLNNFSGEGVGITFSRPIDSTEVNAIGTASSSWELGLFGREGIVFATGGGSTYSATSEQMRLTSTGLGIGTSSPGRRLDVAGNGRVTGGNGIFFEWNNGTDATYVSQETAAEFRINQSTASANSKITLLTQGTLRATLDSSGNLGLGVTPSAWASNWKSMEFGKAGQTIAGFTGSDPLFRMGTNLYTNSGGTDVYASTGSRATQYLQYVGQHIWYTAPSGTAGNAISFTQAMTLDASGNLLLGATSGSSKLVVGSGSGSTATPTAIQMDNTYGTAAFDKLKFYLFKGASESYGFGLGALAEVQYWAGSSSTGTHVWYTSQTERARITSGGDLLVGTTDTAPRNLTSGSGVRIGPSGQLEVAGASDTNYINITAASGTMLEFRKQGPTTVGSISTNGTVTLYNTTSDQRLKENIQDAAPASALIDALQVREYDWKSDGSHQRYGFVAQELVTVVPEAVHQPTDTNKMMAVDYSKLVPMLVKEIQSLRARVAALESI